MTIDEVRSYFAWQGITFEEIPVEGGRRVRATGRALGGASVTFYDSGAVVVGGRATRVKDRLTVWHKSGLAPFAVT